MFGYVFVNKPELKIREFEEYRAYYCGLCRSLGRNYGQFARLTLNYDMTFLVMLLTSLYEPEICTECRRCAVHGFAKQNEKTSTVNDYAADMNMLLAYFKCIDDWKDERKISRLLFSKMLKRKLSKRSIPDEKSAVIRKWLDEICALEKQENADLEELAAAFGNIMAEVFRMKDDMWSENLSKCGFYLGRYIYVLDAYDDIEKDRKKGNFNPLFQEENMAKVEALLNTSAARCAEYFEKLPVIDNIEIMRNILYAGIWVRFDNIKENRKDGSI